MKLQGISIGSNDHYCEDTEDTEWTNLDLHSLPHWKTPPDIQGSIYDLSKLFEAHSFDQIYLGHILEHLDYGQIPQAIEECFKVLKPDGRIAIVGPCIELAIKTEQPYWLLQQIIKHDEDKPGLGHAWTPTALMTLETVNHGYLRARNSAQIWQPGTLTMYQPIWHPDVEPKLVPVNTIRPPEWPNPEPDAMWQCALLIEPV